MATNTVIPLDLGGVNSYLITAGEGFVLVDSGGHLVMDKTFDNRREKLLEALSAAGCTASKLKLILLTHGDNDHVANAAYLRQAFGAPIALHRDDLELVSQPTLEMLMQSYRYRPLVLRMVFRLMRKKITQLTAKTLQDFEPFQPDVLLEDGMKLQEYGVEGAILHLPGHTAGSIGLLLSDGSLLSGDTLACMKKPSPPLNAADFKQLDHSITRLRELGITTVYPGHGHPFAFDSLA